MDNQIFEEWWKNNINVTEIPLFKNQYPDGTWRYTDHKTDLAWEVWKAATKRAADIIENEVCADIAELRTINSNLIEQVVTLLKDTAWSDGIIDMRVDDLIEDVRKLKEDEFPHSANLDIYNSVIFADAPYGTMIMESKIVKWLCRNRAKDYFDEMVKGK